ncbi:alpha/beta hydrolase family protein [Kitasatospora sp. NPDC085464]|uniref:alpha/beta hydrolase family protein n=1 Tax=Kitasatospora sp. NPDC085464 TaxID=3364063 RepID=UPI0037CBC190
MDGHRRTRPRRRRTLPGRRPPRQRPRGPAARLQLLPHRRVLPPRRPRERPRGPSPVRALARELRGGRRPDGHPRPGPAHPLPGHHPARVPLPRRRQRRPRPTIVFTSGFDSTLEESYFALAAAAVRRGYHVLAYDGPGQGAALREQHLVFRPDWEAVATPVIDHALTRPEVDPKRLVLFGYSLGGYLAARAGAHDHRPAALVLDDGLYSYGQAHDRFLPPFLRDLVHGGHDDLADAVLGLLMEHSTQLRWALRNGVWTFGATGPADYLRRTAPYTLEGHAPLITCPTLVLDAENDQFFQGQPHQVQAALTCPHTLLTLTEAEGAGEHCHMGAMARLHQSVFDWLDTTLPHTTTP